MTYTPIAHDATSWDVQVNAAFVSQDARITAIETAGGSGVSSVNGHVGIVVLTTSDVGAAALVHTHAQADVTGLVSALSGKAATVHTHTTADVTGLDTTLTGKAALVHTHAQADVTNLVSDLAAKAATSAVVLLTGNQTVAGIKTFSSAPVFPAASIPTASITGLADVATSGDVGDLTGTISLEQAPAGTTFWVLCVAGVWPARPTARTDLYGIWAMTATTDPAVPAGAISGKDYMLKLLA